MNGSQDHPIDSVRHVLRVPLFPLPDIVFFPHVLLPLHIFESRYRRMVADSAKSDRHIAMALLRPDWEATYDTRTVAIHNTVCLGQITVQQPLEEGRCNLVLRGLSRAVIVEEEENDLPYRVACLELRPDRYPSKPVIDRDHRTGEILALFRQLCPETELNHALYQITDGEPPLGVLCDLVANALPLLPHEAQEILDEVNVDLRSDLLLTQLRQIRQEIRDGRYLKEYPPAFSVN